jgi:rSAM/selenodomain-associated transferase 2
MRPLISIVIPAYNEEAALPAALAAVFRQTGRYEVIVVDGGSSDATEAVVAHHVGVTLLHSSRKGRGVQMNAGARWARGDWLLFLHADTLLPAGALDRIAALNADANCLAGGFRHRFAGDDWRLRLVSWLDNLRCRVSGIVYGDQALFVRADVFAQLGGFAEDRVMEDVEFGERLLTLTRPLLLAERVVTDPRKFVQRGVWRCLAEVCLIIFFYQLRLRLPRLVRGFFADVR